MKIVRIKSGRAYGYSSGVGKGHKIHRYKKPVSRGFLYSRRNK